MNQSPKKIWVPERWGIALGREEPEEKEIPYIRADIVDELVEALKYVLKCWDDDNGYLIDDSMEKARATLSKLEENHD